MAGHSKWANIKYRKEAQDAVRSREFMKLAKEIYTAAKSGHDPEKNPALRLAILKAKSHSMPAKNIKKAIDKAMGNRDDNENYVEYLYEGYLKNGISILVNCLTDNHNRLAANIKLLFKKSGGSIAKKGSVIYSFLRKGIIEIPRTLTEDDLFDIVIDAGVDSIENTNEAFSIICEPSFFNSIKETLEKNKINDFLRAEIIFAPNEKIKLSHKEKKYFLDAIEKFQDCEDVQSIFHNVDLN